MFDMRFMDVRADDFDNLIAHCIDRVSQRSVEPYVHTDIHHTDRVTKFGRAPTRYAVKLVLNN